MRLKSPAPEDGTNVSPLEKPTTYRTGGSLGTGAFLVVFGGIFLFAFGLGSEKHPVGSMVGLFMMVCGIIGGIYPAAFSHTEGLTIRNPFRRIDISWPRVDSITARLSMVIETVPEEGEAHKYTIWAIPVSMHERRRSDRAATKKIRDARAERAKRHSGTGEGALTAAGYGSPRSQRDDPVETMAFADQAVVEMRDRQRACTTSMEKAAATTVRWTWYTLAPFAVSVALLVAAVAGAF